jgi:hypothetical protein
MWLPRGSDSEEEQEEEEVEELLQMLQLLLLLLLLPSLLPLLPSPLAHRRSSTRPTLRDCSSYCATRVASATRS